jgi:hypothetical protein
MPPSRSWQVAMLAAVLCVGTVAGAGSRNSQLARESYSTSLRGQHSGLDPMSDTGSPKLEPRAHDSPAMDHKVRVY